MAPTSKQWAQGPYLNAWELSSGMPHGQWGHCTAMGARMLNGSGPLEWYFQIQCMDLNALTKACIDCLIQNVVYQAAVESPMGRETYIGLTANQFKTRFRNHTASFRNENKRNATELSKHIWFLKDAKTDFTVTWKIMARARPYSNVTKRCNLCITEKFFIICKPGAATLNKRNELASACRHTAKYLIKHSWTINL